VIFVYEHKYTGVIASHRTPEQRQTEMQGRKNASIFKHRVLKFHIVIHLWNINYNTKFQVNVRIGINWLRNWIFGFL